MILFILYIVGKFHIVFALHGRNLLLFPTRMSNSESQLQRRIIAVGIFFFPSYVSLYKCINGFLISYHWHSGSAGMWWFLYNCLRETADKKKSSKIYIIVIFWCVSFSLRPEGIEFCFQSTVIHLTFLSVRFINTTFSSLKYLLIYKFRE